MNSLWYDIIILSRCCHFFLFGRRMNLIQTGNLTMEVFITPKWLWTGFRLYSFAKMVIKHRKKTHRKSNLAAEWWLLVDKQQQQQKKNRYNYNNYMLLFFFIQKQKSDKEIELYLTIQKASFYLQSSIMLYCILLGWKKHAEQA